MPARRRVGVPGMHTRARGMASRAFRGIPGHSGAGHTWWPGRPPAVSPRPLVPLTTQPCSTVLSQRLLCNFTLSPRNCMATHSTTGFLPLKEDSDTLPPWLERSTLKRGGDRDGVALRRAASRAGRSFQAGKWSNRSILERPTSGRGLFVRPNGRGVNEPATPVLSRP